MLMHCSEVTAGSRKMLRHYAGVRTINEMAVGESCVYAKNTKKQILLLQSHMNSEECFQNSTMSHTTLALKV